jgi:hypothetical protein
LAKNLPFLNNKLLTFFNFFQNVSIFDAIIHDDYWVKIDADSEFWYIKPLDTILGAKGDKQIKKC